MTNFLDGILIPGHVSHRTYTLGNETRSIIFNELTHTVLTLDGDSAKVWEKISTNKLDNHTSSFPLALTTEDVIEFIQELMNEQILINDDSLVPQATFNNQSVGSQIENNATQIESDFSDWVEDYGLMPNCFLESTYRCNEKCLHCFNPGASHKVGEAPKRNTNELTLDEYRDLIDELYDLGVYAITVSGGEFFLRKDAFEIMALIKKKNIRLIVFTNGIKLSEDKINKIANLYPHQVHLSLYSANPVTHDKFTQVPNSWLQTISTAKALIAEGIMVILKCPLTKDTAHEHSELTSIANELKSGIRFDAVISAGNDGALEPLDLNITNFNEIVRLALEKDSPWYVGEKNNIKKRTISEGSRPCGIGNSGLSITPEGDILPCVALPAKLGNVRDSGNLTTQWKSKGIDKEGESSIGYWASFSYKDTDECGTHSRCEYCNRCIGASFAQYGDAKKPSEIQCLHASARMQAADLVISECSDEEIAQRFPISADIPVISIEMS